MLRTEPGRWHLLKYSLHGCGRPSFNVGLSTFCQGLTHSVPTDVSCDEWAFSLLPLDVDLLSMELPEFFRDYFVVHAGLLSLGVKG